MLNVDMLRRLFQITIDSVFKTNERHNLITIKYSQLKRTVLSNSKAMDIQVHANRVSILIIILSVNVHDMYI